MVTLSVKNSNSLKKKWCKNSQCHWIHNFKSKIFHNQLSTLASLCQYQKNNVNCPTNTRPVILLKTTRKLLSLIVLHRIRLYIEKYLSNTQAAYRPNRSTKDILWAHKMAIEEKMKSGSKMRITSIDLSSAFDTINRKKLIEILNNIIPTSELQIIKFLLTHNPTHPI